MIKNTLLLIFLPCLIFFAKNSTASNNSDNNTSANSGEKNQYLLQKIAQAPLLEKDTSQWLQLFEQPGSNQYYYLANHQGKIYQLDQDNPNNSSLLLDFQQFSSQQSSHQFNAFTLHPNFLLRDQSGFGTFYTAHIEKAPSNNETKRLLDSNVDVPLTFDAVVIEWQLNQAKQVDFSRQREVLRIGIPSGNTGIKQLSFNPYSKSWHEDFSLLYLSLSPSPKLNKHPLYSGVILRIFPQIVASKDYGVPINNPYYANAQIDKTIYILGAGKIEQFIFPEKHSTTLLISHQYSFNDTVKHWLSYANGGEDWRKQAPKEFIYQNNELLFANNLLVYRGQNAPSLRNKFLLLTQNEQQWQLSSLGNYSALISAGVKQEQKALSPAKVEWRLQQKALQAQKLSIYRDNRDELLIFNEDTGAIYQLFQQEFTAGLAEEQSSTSSGISLLIVAFLGLLVTYILYQVNIRHNSAKVLVRREFSALKLAQDKLTLHLFKRHQKSADKIMTLADINQCQLMLGDLAIATINTAQDHGFNETREQELREIFHNEQIDKMVDGKVRRISLVLSDHEKNNHVICFYLRKGSDRITKKGYFEVVNEVIDWCWIIASGINLEQTGKRSIKPRVTADDIAKAEHKAQDTTPLHAQAAIIRPVTHPKPNKDVIARLHPELKEDTSPHKQRSTAAFESAKVETDLVNAIEKLVKLQQQGFLSADEFAQAKAKLLDRLNNTE